MEQRCLEPDSGWVGGYWLGEVLRPVVLLEPMVKGGVDMLGEAGPPLAVKLGAGESSDTVSGATLRGDCRSREPDIPISRPGLAGEEVVPPAVVRRGGRVQVRRAARRAAVRGIIDKHTTKTWPT